MNRANVDLERRARMYSALGDPMRLAIVDLLSVGDAAPRELSEHFALATNLLAHHLKVLEEAGITRRTRSEGDRRRTYVQLRFDDPTVEALTGAGQHPGAGSRQRLPARVVFVCTHNSARSQLAAAAWGQVSRVPAASAGTHPAARVHPRAVSIGHRHDLWLDEAPTSRVHDVVRRGDLVVAVCDQAHEELADSNTESRRRLHWSVPDPGRVDTNAAFERTYRDIVGRVERLADVLANKDRSEAADPLSQPS